MTVWPNALNKAMTRKLQRYFELLSHFVLWSSSNCLCNLPIVLSNAGQVLLIVLISSLESFQRIFGCLFSRATAAGAGLSGSPIFPALVQALRELPDFRSRLRELDARLFERLAQHSHFGVQFGLARWRESG